MTPQENIAVQQPIANSAPPPRVEEFQQFTHQAYPQVSPSDRTGIFHLISKLSMLGLALGLFLQTFEVFLITEIDASFAERAEYLFEYEFWTTLSGAVFALTALVLGLTPVAAWVRWASSSIIFGLYFLLVLPLTKLENGLTSEYSAEQPLQILLGTFDDLDFLLEYRGVLVFFSLILSMILLQLAPLAATLAMLGATVQAKRLS